MLSRLACFPRATLIAALLVAATPAMAVVDPIPPVHGEVVPQPVWQSKVVSDVVPTINSNWGQGKYHIVEVLATGKLGNYGGSTVRGLGPGVPPALPVDGNGDPVALTMTDGQYMHVYVKTSGPLQHKPLLQWGTIAGSVAFVICIAIRVFKRG